MRTARGQALAAIRKFFLMAVMLFLSVAASPALPQTGGAAAVEAPDSEPSGRIELAPAEKTWLQNHKTIRLGIAPFFPPLKFTENGIIQGIEPDYIKLLAEMTGIKFEFVTIDLSSMDARALAREIDMFLTLNVPQRLAYMTFTKPLISPENVMITRSEAPFVSGVRMLTGKKLATLKGVKGYDKVFAAYPGIERVEVDTLEQMFRAVAESRADALISQIYFVGYVINKYPNLKIAGIADLPPDPYMYAVRQDYPELVSILNKAISSIANSTHETILQKWFNLRVEHRANWHEIWEWAVFTGGAFSLALGLTLFWNRRMAKEIEKRRETESELKGSEARFRQILEQMPISICHVTKEGIVDFRNGSFERLFGYTHDDVPTLTEWWQKAYPDPQYRQWVLDTWNSAVQRAAAEGRDIDPIEYKVTCRSGKEVVVDISGITLGEGFLATFVDITYRKLNEQKIRQINEELELRVSERTAELRTNQLVIMDFVDDLQEKTNELKVANAKLLELDRMKSMFLAAMSHELRTPLNSIIGFSSILHEELKGPLNPEQRKNLAIILRCGNHLLALVNDIIDVSRVEGGNLKAMPEEFDLFDLLEEAVTMLEAGVEEKGLAFKAVTLHLPMYTDRRRLLQCLLNLGSNAIKYSEKGSISVEARAALSSGAGLGNNIVEISVADTGMGIKGEDLPKIFQPFVRLMLPEMSTVRGTGLGLYLAKKLAVDVLQGDISVTSEYGKGSIFTIKIPVRAGQTDCLKELYALSVDSRPAV